MCGIVGIYSFTRPVLDSVIEPMTKRLNHRGPDALGIYQKERYATGHTRLAILDPAPRSNQPFISRDQNYFLSFNGEIYNFLELKKSLAKKGYQHHTNTDTEVLLNLLIDQGPQALNQLNGMFAFAFYDRKNHSLLLARDRMGQKPLYLWQTENHLAFSSETKAFFSHPEFKKEINPTSLMAYLSYDYLPRELSIYKNVTKLLPGQFLQIDSDQSQKQESYFDLKNFLENKNTAPQQTEQNLGEKFIHLLDQSVQKRLISDVDLGVFLSGGLDSSSIVAMMSRHLSANEIKTFSIGFADEHFDESSWSLAVAKRFQTDHHHQVFKPKDLLDILPEVIENLDEPFGDPSVLPTYLLSRFTKEKVTVALSGDGSDELFAGYPTFYAAKLAKIWRYLPVFMPRALQFFAKQLKANQKKDVSFEFKLKQFLRGTAQKYSGASRVQGWLAPFLIDELRLILKKQIPHHEDPALWPHHVMKNYPKTDLTDQLSAFYCLYYLAEDILLKTDRTSMAWGLEVRAPYLDKDIIQFAFELKPKWKLHKKTGKHLVKKALEGILPNDVIWRPKKGFGIPIAKWFSDELKPKLLDLLNPQKINAQGLFDAAWVQKQVQEHLTGRHNHRKSLFNLFMFQLWYEKHMS